MRRRRRLRPEGLRIGGLAEGVIRHAALSAHDEKSPFSPGGQVAYWRVASLESATRYFLSLGATLYRGPLTVENGEAICQICDPFGNALGLIGP
jgi:predicted enzyme related to lactoylglutathione lyase